MVRSVSLFALLLLVIATGSFAVLSNSRSAETNAQAAQFPEVLPSPDEWVAFDANMRSSSPRGTLFGKYFRNSDGSVRRESGPAPGKATMITISNIPLKRYFLLADGAKWASYPMLVPDGGVPAFKMSTSTRGLETTPVAPVEGFQVYRQVSQGNMDGEKVEFVKYVAPQLNFFALIIESPNRTRDEFTDVIVRPQPLDLFVPPPGAQIEIRSEPRGWVFGKEAAAAGIDMEKLSEDVHRRSLH